jgi:hypothetical protein
MPADYTTPTQNIVV